MSSNTNVPQTERNTKIPHSHVAIYLSTALVVLALGTGAFILSKDIQVELAKIAGIGKPLLIPLIIEGGVVGGLLFVLYCSLIKAAWQWKAQGWFFVLLGNALSIYLNFTHAASGNLIAQLMNIAPSLALVITFHLLMYMVEQTVSRKTVIVRLQELRDSLLKLETTFKDRTQKLETDFQNRKQEVEADFKNRKDELETTFRNRTQELEMKYQEVETNLQETKTGLDQKIADRERVLADLEQQVVMTRKTLETAKKDGKYTEISSKQGMQARKAKAGVRRVELAKLIGNGTTVKAELAKVLGVTPKTITADLDELGIDLKAVKAGGDSNGYR